MGAKFHKLYKKWYVPKNLEYSDFSKWWPENLKRFLFLDKYLAFWVESVSGQSTVYYGREIKNGVRCAIKIFNEKKDNQNTRQANIDFIKEMTAFQKLDKHKNIILIEDHGEIKETNQKYYISKWCDYNLYKYIDNSYEETMSVIYDCVNENYEMEMSKEEFIIETDDQPNNIENVYDDIKILMYPILETLKFCHEKGIYHRDIKPQNIFLEFDFENDLEIIPKIGDFGISKDNPILKNTNTRVDMVSEPWGPPRTDREVEFQNTWDIYGWAAMTISLINETIPFSYKELDEMITSDKMKTYDAIFIGLLRNALDKNPSKRPQNISEYTAKIKELFFPFGIAK